MELTVSPIWQSIPSSISRSVINKRLFAMASDKVKPSRKGAIMFSVTPNLVCKTNSDYN